MYAFPCWWAAWGNDDVFDADQAQVLFYQATGVAQPADGKIGML